MIEARAVIVSIPFFSGLPPTEIDRILSTLLEKSFEKNEIILWETEISKFLYIVKAGWIKAIRTSEKGREQVINVMETGSVFNLTSVFSKTPLPVRVVALERTWVYLIPPKTMEDLLRHNPNVSKSINAHFSATIHHLIGLIDDLSLTTIESRLAKWLLNQAEAGVIQRKKWETQETIAAQVGTVIDVLNRALRKFEKEKLITVSRDTITIDNQAQLKKSIKELLY